MDFQKRLIAKRNDQITSFIVMEILEKAVRLEREGRSIIHLEIGEPDFDTPEPIREAGIRAIKEGKTHYTPSLGIPQLREAIAEFYHDYYGVDVSPERVVVTNGTSGAFLLVMAAILDIGDEVIFTDPGYPCYPNFARSFDANPVFVPVYEEENFEVDIQRLKEALSPRTKAILIASPANPTGTLTSPEKLKEALELAPFFISDEIYHGLVYEGKEHTALEFSDKAIVINGFSKLFAMTGWRLGWVIVPEDLLKTIHKLAQNLFICPNSISQYAALAAFKESWDYVLEMKEKYNERRLEMIKGLREIGFEIKSTPAGAFYVFANISKFSDDSFEFAHELLDNAGVAATPGVDFGKNRTNHYIRFSYANSLENIREAIERIKTYLKERA